MKPMILLAACAAALTLPAAADAAVQYTISGQGHVAIFTLDSTPTPEFLDDGYSFAVTTTGTFDGVADPVGVTFYLNPFEGPADVLSGGLTYLENTTFFQVDVAGPQLFAGSIYAPVLLTFGPQEFVDLDSGDTFTISAQAVPEAATWAMMLAGFGLAGTAMRRRNLSMRMIA